MRKKREELIFGCIGVDQLVPQSDVASFVFHEIKDALDGLISRLQTQKRNVDEVGHASFVLKWLLDQLKRRAERKHTLNRIDWRDLYIIVAHVGDLATAGQPTKSLGHLAECFVGL